MKIIQKIHHFIFGRDEFDDFLDIYELLYFIFQFTGFGLNDFPRKWQTRLYHLFHLLCYFQYLSMIGAYIQYVNEVAVHETKELLHGIGIMIVGVGVTMKIFIMEFLKHHMKNVHRTLQVDLNLPYLQKMPWYTSAKEHTDRDFLKLVATFGFAVSFIIIIYIIPMFFANERELPIMTAGIPEMSYTAYICFLVYEFVFMLNVGAYFFSYDLAACGLMYRLCFQQQLIVSSIDNITKNFPLINYSDYIVDYEDYAYNPIPDEYNFFPDEIGPDEKFANFKSFDVNYEFDPELTDEIFETFKQNVIHYHEIAKEMKIVEFTYSSVISLQILGGTIVAAVFGVVVIMSGGLDLKILRQLWFTIITFYDLYMYCLSGTRMERYREKICFALYNCPWYEMDLRLRKVIIQGIIMMQRTLKFEAGGLMQINNEAYLQVLKLGYNLITAIVNLL